MGNLLDDLQDIKHQKVLGPDWTAARKRAIATLDPQCAICGKYIDVQLPRQDPKTKAWNHLSVEVDHIIPRARGGAMYALSNLQLSHSICNRRKGSKMESDYEDIKQINQVPLSNQW